jgi:pantetheine-phosphate adenylyltransferase
VLFSHFVDGPLLRNKKYKELIEPFETRKKAIEDFLHIVNPSIRPDVVCLEGYYGKGNVLCLDVAGPTLTDPTITGLVASEESKANALWVNQQRKEKGWTELSLVPFI